MGRIWPCAFWKPPLNGGELTRLGVFDIDREGAISGWNRAQGSILVDVEDDE